MYQFIYTSEAVQIFTQADLKDLIIRAQVHNAQNGITGMLIYENGIFTQILEGKFQELEILMEKIIRDPRHNSVQILKKNWVEFRHYNHWMLGFNSDSVHNLVKIL